MVTRVDRKSALRFVAGLAVGWATSWTVLTGGFSLLRVAWPDYALASRKDVPLMMCLPSRHLHRNDRRDGRARRSSPGTDALLGSRED